MKEKNSKTRRLEEKEDFEKETEHEDYSAKSEGKHSHA